MLGWGWLEAVDPAERSAFETGWREALAAARPVRAVVGLRGTDGRCRRFELRAAPLRNLAGELVAWVVVGRDVEEPAVLAERLRRSEQATAEARRALDGAGAAIRSASGLLELGPQPAGRD